MFNIKSERPLPSKEMMQYIGIAYDGSYFYLTVNHASKIVQYDKCFCRINCFDTCRCYSDICYDNIENCFWAADDCGSSKLYKLNACLEEIDFIPISKPWGRDCKITGIAFNCQEDKLLVSFNAGIVSIDKKNPEGNDIISKNGRDIFLGIVSISPYYISLCHSSNRQVFRIYSQNGILIEEFDAPYDVTVLSVVFVPCIKDSCDYRFYVLVCKKGCYPYILDCALERGLFNECICECNYTICEMKCCDCCDHRKCCNDVLESIALVEASIAHILNAEGEKLQKVVSSTDDIDKILRVNKSVGSIIEKMIRLEQILYAKMDALDDCADFCDNLGHDCDCGCGCHSCCKECCQPILPCKADDGCLVLDELQD